jgi:hypothetical protein
MSDGNWKDLIRAQHADLEKLEALDAELNDDRITTDIDKVLKKTNRIGSFSGTSSRKIMSTGAAAEAVATAINADDDSDEMLFRRSPPKPMSRAASANSALRVRRDSGVASAGAGIGSPLSRDGGAPRDDEEIPVDPLDGAGSPRAPDTSARYQKAKLKMLTKQLEDSLELRKQLTETVTDLQRQLKNEREENKKNRKRIQLLEAESKRLSNRRDATAPAADTVEALTQEVAQLRKDMQTAERLAKQSDVSFLSLTRTSLGRSRYLRSS